MDEAGDITSGESSVDPEAGPGEGGKLVSSAGMGGASSAGTACVEGGSGML